MKRRQFIVGAAALGTAELPFFRIAAEAAVPNRLIDAHCHIFNADDLPVVGFVEKVVLTDHPDFHEAFKKLPHAADFFVRFLGRWLQGKAFSTQDEIDHLELVKAHPSEARDPDVIRDHEILHLTDLIIRLRKLRLDRKEIPFGERIFGFYVPGVIIGLMHREAFPMVFKGKGINDNSDGAFNTDNWYEPDYLARYVYLRGNGQVSRYLRWGLRLTRYRSELADELALIHGGKARLVTPALIDYSRWLNDPHNVKLAGQVAAMARIAQRPGATRVHAFAPFDPLREAMHRIASPAGAEAPLALAKRAVTENGFIGVKLYPPMGFRPLGNVQLSTANFPAHIHERFHGRKIGADIDVVLTELYTWCAAEQVPILAHASDSNGSAPGYSARANPEYWAAVIDMFPSLRLSLAHFGDFDEGFKSGKRPHPKLTDTWEWKMAKLINEHPNSLIFADVSYFRAAMLPTNTVRNEVIRMFKETLMRFPLIAKRMIFGSDWIMLGQEERFGSLGGGGRYSDRIDVLLGAFELNQADRAAIMFSNPSGFLGLDNVQATVGNRVRLKSFYAKHGIPDAWLDEMAV